MAFTDPGSSAAQPPNLVTFTGSDIYGKRAGTRVQIARNASSGSDLTILNAIKAASNLGEASGHAVVYFAGDGAAATTTREPAATVKGRVEFKKGNQKSSIDVPAPKFATLPKSNVIDVTDANFIALLAALDGVALYNDGTAITATLAGDFRSARIVGRKTSGSGA